MADSKVLVEQKDDGQELRLAAEHHEFVPTYNDQDLFGVLFTNPTEDFEFVPLEEIVESGKTSPGQTVAASQAPDGTQMPRRRRSLWNAMKGAFDDVCHGDLSEEHTVKFAASEQPSVMSEPNKQEKAKSSVMGWWPEMEAVYEQEWSEEFYE